MSVMTHPEKGYVILDVGYGYNDEIYTIGTGYDIEARIIPLVYLTQTDAEEEMRKQYKSILHFNVGDCSDDFDEYTEPIVRWLDAAAKAGTSLVEPKWRENEISYSQAIAALELAGQDILPYMPPLLQLIQVDVEIPPTEEEVRIAANNTVIIHNSLARERTE